MVTKSSSKVKRTVKLSIKYINKQSARFGKHLHNRGNKLHLKIQDIKLKKHSTTDGNLRLLISSKLY